MADYFQSLVADFKAYLSRPRDAMQHTLNLCLVVLTAFMMWRTCVLWTGSETPVVVVLSGSMEPAFQRGDILFIQSTDRLHAGDIPVFRLDGRDIPIVHRLTNTHFSDKHPQDAEMLTKGDNNGVDDRGLYPDHQLWLRLQDVIGITFGYIPSVGMLTIWLNEYPMLKWLLVGAMVLTIVMGYD